MALGVFVLFAASATAFDTEAALRDALAEELALHRGTETQELSLQLHERELPMLSERLEVSLAERHAGVASLNASARLASLVSKRMALLTLRDLRAASSISTANLTTHTGSATSADSAAQTPGRRLGVNDFLDRVYSKAPNMAQVGEKYSQINGQILANGCPKLPTRAAPTTVEDVTPGDIRAVMCAGDEWMLAVNAKGTSMLGASFLAEKRKNDGTRRQMPWRYNSSTSRQCAQPDLRLTRSCLHAWTQRRSSSSRAARARQIRCGLTSTADGRRRC